MSPTDQMLMDLYKNENNDADVTFVVHGEEVKAHKIIIAARCEVLKTMVESDLAPADGRHLITDKMIVVEDFKNFLKFLYLDQCDINYNNIGAVLHMSDMYIVPSLKKKCLEFVKHKSNNSVDECFQYCELGITYEKEYPEMLPVCLEILSRKGFYSFSYNSSDGKCLVSTVLMERIVKDCPRTGILTEDKLLMKLMEWGQRECKALKIPVDSNGIKAVLDPFIKHFKFENCSLHSWVNIIDPNELASRDECHKTFADFVKRSSRTALKITPQMLKQGIKPEQMIGSNSDDESIYGDGYARVYRAVRDDPFGAGRGGRGAFGVGRGGFGL